jgi:hypothetical protein
VLLGTGIPFFAHLEQAPVHLEDPRIVQGQRATHLYYLASSPSLAAAHQILRVLAA